MFVRIVDFTNSKPTPNVVEVCRFRRTPQVISQGQDWMCSMQRSIIDWLRPFRFVHHLGSTQTFCFSDSQASRDDDVDGIILICSSRKKSPLVAVKNRRRRRRLR